MALNLTLKPFERVVVNGAMIRNGGRKTTMTFETRAEIIRETDLLKPTTSATPVNTAYFLIQSALIYPERREQLVKAAHRQLAALATTFGPPTVGHIFDAANKVSQGEFFSALRSLRPAMAREAEIFGDAMPKTEWAGEPDAAEWKSSDMPTAAAVAQQVERKRA
ncbi:flagellar biosynthesis repressor FlbT [Oceanicola sp. 22II-s10i]|uniref:flagellar biosynthesis repressor FlbT n=1 Tax=Oceanicola sp. 22II-s10i TaxID=1317116 RepID=UPI000B524598|nr:flagellar biosynthesis repressor FlbT [Oceanicola sp. 22II-s10i]